MSVCLVAAGVYLFILQLLLKLPAFVIQTLGLIPLANNPPRELLSILLLPLFSTESSRNFSINTRDPNGLIENHLFLGHDKFECLSAGFRINDTNGRSLFSVNRNEVTIGAHSLRIDGEGGAVFRESVQTPHVRAEPGRELR